MAITAPLLAGYLLALLFTSVRQSSTNFFNAMGETKTPVINSSIGIGINIVLNFILSRFMGVLGLVAATVVSSAISAILLMIAVKRRNTYVDYRMGVPNHRRYVPVFNTDAPEFGGGGFGDAKPVPVHKQPSHGREYSVDLQIPPFGAVFLRGAGAYPKRAAKSGTAKKTAAGGPKTKRRKVK